MEITVGSLESRNMCTVLGLKSRIHLKHKIPSHQQDIYFEGKHLCREHTLLKDYGLKKESVLLVKTANRDFNFDRFFDNFKETTKNMARGFMVHAPIAFDIVIRMTKILDKNIGKCYRDPFENFVRPRGYYEHCLRLDFHYDEYGCHNRYALKFKYTTCGPNSEIVSAKYYIWDYVRDKVVFCVDELHDLDPNDYCEDDPLTFDKDEDFLEGCAPCNILSELDKAEYYFKSLDTNQKSEEARVPQLV